MINESTVSNQICTLAKKRITKCTQWQKNEPSFPLNTGSPILKLWNNSDDRRHATSIMDASCSYIAHRFITIDAEHKSTAPFNMKKFLSLSM